MNLYWSQKKQLSNNVTTTKINKICKIATENGAYGAKLLGAGGGGFVYILCSPNKKQKIIKKLSKYKNVNFQFENSGSCIIYNKFRLNEKKSTYCWGIRFCRSKYSKRSITKNIKFTLL